MKKFLALFVIAVVMIFSIAVVSCAAAQRYSSASETVSAVQQFFWRQYKANALGKPLSASKITKHRSAMSPSEAYVQDIKFDGVTLSFYSDSKKMKNLNAESIKNIEVTKSKWQLPGGINIGMNRKTIESLVKNAGDDINDTVYGSSFAPDDGSIEVTYQNNNASKLDFFQQW